MARLPRLVLAGQTHLVVLRARPGAAAFVDAADREAFVAALREAALAECVRIHAWALLDHELQLLATPDTEAGLSRLMQALGRRYVSAYNRRHGSKGALWDGRFRCGIVEPGPMRLAALLWVDGQSAEPGQTTAVHRSGGPAQPLLTELPEVWTLGNTPFEREAAYSARLAQGVPAREAQALRRAALGGWVAGSAAFAEAVADQRARPALPRPRGRPRKPQPA